MSNEKIVEQFYTAFSEGDYNKMSSFYAHDVVFSDPVFLRLNGEKASKMWEMLLTKAKIPPKIKLKNISSTDNHHVSAEWTAEYKYGQKQRSVVNIVKAQFTIIDNSIVKHTDTFDLWKWAGQALGPVGKVFGWSPFFKSQIRKKANTTLENFISLDHR